MLDKITTGNMVADVIFSALVPLAMRMFISNSLVTGYLVSDMALFACAKLLLDERIEPYREGVQDYATNLYASIRHKFEITIEFEKEVGGPRNAQLDTSSRPCPLPRYEALPRSTRSTSRPPVTSQQAWRRQG